MKLAERIDCDYRCLASYFKMQFQALEGVLTIEKSAPVFAQNLDADDSQAPYHSISHFIKPDMLINTFSFLDFWAKAVCEAQKRKRNLTLGYRDIKGNNDLHGYHKYLTSYAGIDLSTIQDSYQQLDNLRKVRNKFIHQGGHILGDQEIEYASIKGISVSSLLIFIEDVFIWNSLEHAKKYLQTVAVT